MVWWHQSAVSSLQFVCTKDVHASTFVVLLLWDAGLHGTIMIHFDVSRCCSNPPICASSQPRFGHHVTTHWMPNRCSSSKMLCDHWRYYDQWKVSIHLHLSFWTIWAFIGPLQSIFRSIYAHIRAPANSNSGRILFESLDAQTSKFTTLGQIRFFTWLICFCSFGKHQLYWDTGILLDLLFNTRKCWVTQKG